VKPPALRLLIGLLSLTLTACSGPVAPSDSPMPQSSDSAVVRIEQTGGMMPPWITVNAYPSVVIYEDGRLIRSGPVDAMYPGPALPNLLLTQLTPAGMEQVMEWASEVGLDGPDAQVGQPFPDGGVVVFTIVRPTGTHVTTLAQGTEDDARTSALLQFQGVLLDIRAWLEPDQVSGDDQPYEWDRLQLLASPFDVANAADPQLVTLRDWPLDDLSLIGRPLGDAMYRCFVLRGSDLDGMRPEFQTATQLTYWRSADATYQLDLRPLLPDEEGCPGG
jgi:hypothetical protein